MSPKVYLVTEGSYSDYRVRAAFADEALAKAHAERIYGEVEEYALFTRAPKRITVYFKSSGHESSKAEPTEWSVVIWEYENGEYRRLRVVDFGTRTRPALRVEGTDRAAVRKAFDDRWAQKQAEREGIA